MSQTRMHGRTRLAAIGAIGLLTSVTGAESRCLKDVDAFHVGPASAVAALGSGRTVAAATGGRIEILDLDEPAGGEVGSVEVDGWVTEMDVAGDRLWIVTDPPRLIAVDLRDPSEPVVAASRELPAYPYHVAASGDLVAVALDGHVLVLDALDPRRIRPLALLGGTSNGYPGGVDLEQNLLYHAAYDSKTLEVWDVATPGHPQRVGELALSSQPVGRVVVEDGLAAVGAYGILLVDVTDPAMPREVGITGDDLEDVAWHFDMQGSRIAYLTSVTNELSIVDVGDPSSPYRVSQGDRYAAGRGVAVVGLGAVIANGPDGVCATSQPDVPIVATFGAALSVAFAGDLLVFGDDGGSVGVLSADGDQGRLPLEGVLTLDGGPWSVWRQNVHVAADGDLAVAVHLDAVSVLDVSDPTSPRELVELPTSGLAIDAAVRGDLAFAATETELVVVDVANPAAARRLGAVEHGIAALRDIELGPGWAALVGVLTGSAGTLSMVDLTDPATPEIVSVTSLASQAHGAAARGDLLIVAAGDAGLLTVDVGDPASPVVVSAFPVGDTAPAYRVWLDGDVAWVGAGTGAACPLRRIDLADPFRPVDLGCVAGWSATSIAFAGDRMAVARGAAGIALGPRGCAPELRPVMVAAAE